MSVTRVLLDILIVLAAAKIAAEIAERAGIPAVVGEIVAGVLIGPSAIGLVRGDDVLRVLGEIGVILLLLDVGLEMDLGQLAAVGRSALSVATIGVIVPMAAGGGLALALGLGGKEALFVGAALTATSVGITARVFGDLRALATVEARTVLGAAVADDVMGLVILTVVTRLVSQGSISAGSVVSIVVVAVGFLVVASVVGIRVAPWVFTHISRLSRSPGTLVALSLAFTLGLAELANLAKLAPIVGAFVAGLALSRSELAPRIRRELMPVGHLFVPVFFLQIGIDAQIREFTRLHVLGIAGALLVVAVLGKIVAAVGMVGAPGDRLLVGLGMIPRGEVGLIFATLGLTEGIIGRDVYAALLLVVLATTLITPTLLKVRLRAQRRRAAAIARPARDEPPGGWLQLVPAGRGQTIDLVEEPSDDAALTVGLDAALAVAGGAAPGERLVTWLTTLPVAGPADDNGPAALGAIPADARAAVSALLARADARTWRFLLVTGLLDRALPEVAETLRHRQADPFESDPTRTLSWPRLARINERVPSGADRLVDEPIEQLLVERADQVRLAALVLDANDLNPRVDQAVPLARKVAGRLGLPPDDAEELEALVGAAELLPAAARRLDGLDEEPVLQVATHLGSRERARLAGILAATSPQVDPSGIEIGTGRLNQLLALIDAVLARPELSGAGSTDLTDQRRQEASRLIPDAARRIAITPLSFVLSQTAADLARQASLADPPLGRGEVRAAVSPVGDGTWRLDAAVRDDVGLLAKQLAVLREQRCEVLDVATVVWPDRQSLSTFRLRAASRPSGDRLGDDIAAAIATRVTPLALPGADVTFDNASSPWHTICTARADDDGLVLLALAKAVALCDVNVVAARVIATDSGPAQVLELATRRGVPVPPETQTRILDVLASGDPPSLRRRKVGGSPVTRS